LVATVVVVPLALVVVAAAPTAGALPRDEPLNASPVDVPCADRPLVWPRVGTPLAVDDDGVVWVLITEVALAGDMFDDVVLVPEVGVFEDVVVPVDDPLPEVVVVAVCATGTAAVRVGPLGAGITMDPAASAPVTVSAAASGSSEKGGSRLRMA
jgi:hypothetical protein